MVSPTSERFRHLLAMGKHGTLSKVDDDGAWQQNFENVFEVLFRQRFRNLILFVTYAVGGTCTRKARTESYPDCPTCAEFARQRKFENRFAPGVLEITLRQRQ